MSIWSDAPDTHFRDSPEPGTVVAVDADQATMAVKWRDVGGAITYPLDAMYLRKAFPWE